ncbi:MAG: TonB family protein [Pseudomonadota bacterium]
MAVALGAHGLLLLAIVHSSQEPISVAGGRIEVRFGNTGRNTAEARADQGIKSGSEKEPNTPAQSPAARPPEPLTESTAELLPVPVPEAAPEQPADPPDVTRTDRKPPEVVPETEPEPPVATPPPAEARVATPVPPSQPPVEPPVEPPVQAPVPAPVQQTAVPSTNGRDVSVGDRGASETEGQDDAINSVASPESGSPTGDTNAQNTNRQAGNAEASNYAGNIVRILSRERLPSSLRKGAALISFSIAQNGDIARISVKDSSGSKRFDRAAMELIKDCAPFPEPPRGAKLDYSVVIKKD